MKPPQKAGLSGTTKDLHRPGTRPQEQATQVCLSRGYRMAAMAINAQRVLDRTLSSSSLLKRSRPQARNLETSEFLQ